MEWFNIIQAISSIYGVYLSLGMVIFIILSVLTIFLVSIFTKTPFGFGIGFLKLNFGNKDSILNKQGLIDNILEFQEEHIKNVAELESTTIKRQLTYTEQKLSQLKYLLTNNYLNLLQKKIKSEEDIKLNKDYRSYQILIGMLIRDLVDKVFHPAFIENHLDEFDDGGWSEYLEDKSKYIFNFNADFLDNLYTDGRLVSRNESYEGEKVLYADIKEIFKSIFENAKEISIQSRADLKKENDQAELHIKQICKNNGFELESK